MESARLCLDGAVVFHVFHQVQTVFIEPEVHNRDAVRTLFYVHDLFLHAPKLRLPVGQISFFLGIDEVIVSGRRQYGCLHATLHAGFQINVFVERYIRPEVDQLNAGIPAAYAVHATKALDDAHRVPVNVVVNQIVAVL